MKEILKEFEYLPRLSEFVIRDVGHQNHIESFIQCCNYTRFITQPLTKGMFVPCDEEGNVFEKPKHYDDNDVYVAIGTSYYNYQQAKDRVIFSLNINVIEKICFMGEVKWHLKSRFKTIEDAINAGVKLKYK